MGGRRSRDRVVLFWSSVLFGAACAAPVSAQNVIPAYDSGWYDVTGFHDPGNTNFICGLADVSGAGGEFRFVTAGHRHQICRLFAKVGAGLQAPSIRR